MDEPSQTTGLGFFVALDQADDSQLVQRMSGDELPVDGERYGVKSRLIARRGVTVEDLASAAIAKLLQATSVRPEQLGGIVLSSRIPEPEAAAECIGRQFNVTTASGIERACSGFPAAVDAALQLRRRTDKPLVVVTAEIISRSVNWEPATGELGDQRRARGQAAKLFADGAAAVLVGDLSPTCPHEVLDAWHGEVADEQQLIQKIEVEDVLDPWGEVREGTTSCMTMPGRRGYWLVKRAPGIMSDAVARSLENARRTGRVAEDAVSHVVPHQANGLILSRMQKEMSDTKVWNCIDNNGNTVSASIPLAMSRVQSKLESGELVAMPSVGAGGPGYRPDVLSTGCVLIRVGDTASPG